jgi:SAM-dependent methyltransferase
MQRPDIISLRQFYSSALGRKVKKRLRQLVVDYWPERNEETIIGLGYATPLMRVLERAGGGYTKLAAAMPAQQGAIYWPVHSDNRSFLADELSLPLSDNSVHRLVVLHAFEYCAEPEKLLEECYRVLVAGGRMILVVPNRRGLWQGMGDTPYAQGTPYRVSHLKHLMNEAEFTLREVRTALFTLPISHPVLLRAWEVWERLFGLVFWGLGGVVVMEVEKQIYAAIPEPVLKKAKRQGWVGEVAPAG